MKKGGTRDAVGSFCQLLPCFISEIRAIRGRPGLYLVAAEAQQGRAGRSAFRTMTGFAQHRRLAQTVGRLRKKRGKMSRSVGRATLAAGFSRMAGITA
jgi:hypothetical protein